MPDETLGASAKLTADGSSYLTTFAQATVATTALDEATQKVNKTYGLATRAQRDQQSAISLATRAQQQMDKELQDRAYASYSSNIRATQQLSASYSDLARTRYALYDVATTWGAIATATLGTVGATESVGVAYEAMFAQVTRTTDATSAQLGNLRTELVDLTTDIPSNFQNISQIATLGGQLGIAEQNIQGFTESVAEFSSTTNASIQDTATGFGRIAQLTKAGSDSFNKIGSAIYTVGINSVATETQILSIAQEISTAGNLAGFSTAQIIGLAGALASLGVQPYLARGSTTRIFAEINSAIADSGAELQNFAKLSGMTADEFTQQWKSAPEATFAALINGLHAASQEGQPLSLVLKAIGITSSNDVKVMSLLADNTDVFAKTQADANAAYADGTTLAKGYGIVADTASSYLSRLANTLKGIADAASNMGILKSVLKDLVSFTQGILAFVRTPVGSAFSAIALSIGAVVGAFAAFKVAQALTTASVYALVTAQRGLAESTGITGTGIAGLSKELLIFVLGADRATAATEAFNASQASGAGFIKSTGAALKSTASGITAAGTALKGLAISFGVTAVIGVAIAAIARYGQEQQEAQQYVDDLTQSLDSQTGALTDNSRSIVYNGLVKAGIPQLANQYGVSLKTITDAALGNKDALNTLSDAYEHYEAIATSSATSPDQAKAQSEAAGAAAAYTKILGEVGHQQGAVTSAQKAYAQAQEAGVNATDQSADSIDDLSDASETATQKLQDLVDTSWSGVDATANFADSVYGLGSSLAQNGKSFDVFSASGRANLEALDAVINSAVQASAGDANQLAVYIQAIMSTLGGFGVNVAQQIPTLITLQKSLPTAPLQGVAQAANLAGSALRGGFADGAKKAAKSSQAAQKEVKTLSDYVDDLEQVAKNAFDFRFGLEQATDSTANAYQKLADDSNDAQKAISDAASTMSDDAQKVKDLRNELEQLDAKIQGLKADRTILQYQLKIANEYGDSLRAQDITASLAQNTADLNDAESDRSKNLSDTNSAQKQLVTDTQALGKAQQDAIRTTVGNTQSIRDQRSAVLDLVQQYEDQIVAYANTGASSDQVKAKAAALQSQFYAQMTQLGYTRGEAEKYGHALSDISDIINQLPKNLTLSINTDPAQRALDEFIAKNNNKQLNTSVSGDGAAQGAAAGNAYGVAWTNAVMSNRRLLQIKSAQIPGGIGYQYKYSNGTTSPVFFDKGGYTGRGGKYDPAGIVHKGEYVVPSQYVNQSTGLPYMNALGAIMSGYAGGGYVSSPSVLKTPAVQLVEIMPYQVQQIASALKVMIGIDGNSIASATNNVNSASARRGSN